MHVTVAVVPAPRNLFKTCFCVLFWVQYELWSKLLKGDYFGDYFGLLEGLLRGMPGV